MNITIDTAQFSRALEKKKAALLEAVRPAAQAGAQEIYDEAKQRAPVSEKAHLFYGSAAKNAPKGQKKQLAYLFQPGTLRDAIYQVYSEDNSGPSIATYHVAWNHTKAPYGFMVEYGTSRAPAHPFLRPAIDASRDKALSAMKARFLQEVNKP